MPRHPLLICRNPRCGEPLERKTQLALSPLALCPSCRLAASWGALAAGAVAFLIELIRVLR